MTKCLSSWCLSLCCLIAVFSSPPCTEAQTAASAAPFTAWLEDFQALDALERQLAAAVEQTPEIILKRARLLLRLNKPEPAMELLNDHGPFSYPDLEAERLWTRAQARRLSGESIQALADYVAAAERMPFSTQEMFFQRESQFDRFFKDVWMQWFWSSFNGAQLQVPEQQMSLMHRASALARSMWPEDGFWDVAFAVGPSEPDEPSVAIPGTMNVLPVLGTEQDVLVQCLAACSLGNWDRARELAAQTSGLELRSFWQLFITALEQGIDALPSRSTALPTPGSSVFWDLYDIRLSAERQAEWIITDPEAPFWKDFRQGLDKEPADRALKFVDAELRSTLLAPDIKNSLQQLALAYALVGNNIERFQDDFARLNPQDMPLCLLTAAAILDLDAWDSILANPQVDSDPELSRMVLRLAQAAGKQDMSSFSSPFWLVTQDWETLREALRTWPLDRSLAYAVHAREWSLNPDSRSARRMAYLYPLTSQGQQALLYLARTYSELGRQELAWLTVLSIPFDTLSPAVRDDYLEARAGLAMEMGREDLALQTYEELLEKTPERMPAERKLRLALLAQQKGRWDLADSILQGLRNQKSALAPALQAEVLFWIAEGEQQRNRLDEALDHYLELAWTYPGQNIWAITALYRAGLIYEQKGMLATARQLFTTVLKRADRESQREAAQDRIDALSTMIKDREDTPAPWVYPF